ncbi:MAG: hypothetical protein SFU56_06795 [Capsulimonadales bacterium]|nr:hypothetical protein [Capsulimonadales bacterium]
MGDNRNGMFIGVGAIVVAILAAVISFNVFLPKSSPPVTVRNPNSAMLKELAMKCQGDASRLSMEEQQKVAQAVGGPQYIGLAIKGEYARWAKK